MVLESIELEVESGARTDVEQADRSDCVRDPGERGEEDRRPADLVRLDLAMRDDAPQLVGASVAEGPEGGEGVARGEPLGRPRVKFVRTAEMLEAARAANPA